MLLHIHSTAALADLQATIDNPNRLSNAKTPAAIKHWLMQQTAMYNAKADEKRAIIAQRDAELAPARQELAALTKVEANLSSEIAEHERITEHLVAEEMDLLMEMEELKSNTSQMDGYVLSIDSSTLNASNSCMLTRS